MNTFSQRFLGAALDIFLVILLTFVAALPGFISARTDTPLIMLLYIPIIICFIAMARGARP